MVSAKQKTNFDDFYFRECDQENECFMVDGVSYSVISHQCKTVEVTFRRPEFDPYSGHVIIPSEVNYNSETYTVTAIRSCAFYLCGHLLSVTLPDTIIKIGRKAFGCCFSLEAINIPDSVQVIKAEAFINCENLAELNIGDGVMHIDTAAFYGCKSLAKLKIGQSVKRIGDCAFGACRRLETLDVPDSVVSIGSEAFAGCVNLEDITLGSSVTDITTNIFYNCTSLLTIAVDGRNKKFDSRNRCNALISTSDNKLVLGIQTSVIPNSVVEIGAFAFMGCMWIEKIDIPESVKKIGRFAFNGCTNLAQISIPDSVINIGDFAFNDTKWLFNQPNGVVYAAKVAYCYKGKMASDTSITIAEGTIAIADYAFYLLKEMTSVTLPGSIVRIGDYAFANCTGLQHFNYQVSKTLQIGDGAFENVTLISDV